MRVIRSNNTIYWLWVFITCFFVSDFAIATEVLGVVYERSLTEEERSREHLDYLDYPMKGEKSLREYQDMYRKEKVPEDIIRVELVDADPHDGIQELRLYSIERGYDMIRMNNKWIEEHKDVLPLDIDPKVYRVTDTIMSRVDRIGAMYYPGMGKKDRVGFVAQEFEKIKGGQSWSMRLYDTSPHEIDFHDLLRPIIQAPAYEQQKSPTGIIYSYINPKEPDGVVAAAWISGPHFAVYVAGTDIDLDEIVAVVAKKYPSSMKAALEIDKTKWFRQEIDMRLDQMAREAESNSRDPDGWDLHFRYLMLNVSLPKLAGLQRLDELNWEDRERTNNQLKHWWNTMRGEMVWDDAKKKLVVEEDVKEDAPGAHERRCDIRLSINKIPTANKMSELDVTLVYTNRSDKGQVKVWLPEGENTNLFQDLHVLIDGKRAAFIDPGFALDEIIYSRLETLEPGESCSIEVLPFQRMYKLPKQWKTMQIDAENKADAKGYALGVILHNHNK